MKLNEPATPKQVEYLHILAQALNWEPSRLRHEATERYGTNIDKMSKGEASRLIDWLRRMRDGTPQREQVEQ